jgi:hypothetical protein
MKTKNQTGTTTSHLKIRSKPFSSCIAHLVTLGILLQPTTSLALFSWFQSPNPTQSPAPRPTQPPPPPLESIWLKVSDEIQETQELLHKLSTFCGSRRDCDELQKLYSNYKGALEFIRSEKPYYSPVISGSYKTALLGALQGGQQIFPAPISLQSTVHLIEHIEAQLPQWKTSLKPIPPLKLSNEITLYFLYQRISNQLLIRTRLEPIGRGANKTVIEVFNYPRWERLALGTSHRRTPRDLSIGLPNEQKVFQALSKISRSEGLVETLHADPRFLLQRAYSPVQVGALDSLPLLTRLKLLEQITTGLTTLHQKEICHGDIKEENLLVSKDNDIPEEAVLTDFDLSYSPRDLIVAGKRRPFRGSLPLVAPELIQTHLTAMVTGWFDGEPTGTEKKIDLQIKTALKADIFALASMTSAILRPKEKQWFEACHNPTEPFFLLRCQQATLGQYLFDLGDGPYQSLNQLLISALEPLPENRIDSQQFLKGIRHLRKKATPETPLSAAEGAKKPEPSKLIKSITDSVPIEIIEGTFRKAKPGNYLLSWHVSKDGSRDVRFSFLDPTGLFFSYLWGFNPARPEFIEEEVEFLKTIGRIRGEPLAVRRTGV